MYDLLARLFDDQPNTVALISAHDGCIEYMNSGTWGAVAPIREADMVGQNLGEVFGQLGFPTNHPAMLALRDGRLHAAPSTVREGHWTVAAKLPSSDDTAGYIFSAVYPASSEAEALERHARDVSRVMIAIEFEAVWSLLGAASDTIRVAQRRAEAAFSELDVLRWSVSQDAQGR